jgi:hypothetical protein
MTETKPKRRWFKFSLRALLVLITLMCVWLASQVNSARRQKEAVTAILKVGGMVNYDWQYGPPAKPTGNYLLDYGQSLSNSGSPPRPWLSRVFGDDCFQTATGVLFNTPNPNATKADYDQIANLPALKFFCLGPTDNPAFSLNGSELASLAELKNLELLQLYGTHITGEMIAKWQSLDTLKSISICNCDFDDSGMDEIGKMKNLILLELDGTRITDAGLIHLRNLIKLKQLYLHRTRVTSDGMQHLKGLTQLVELWVQQTGVSSLDIPELKKMLPNTTIFGP